jgi:hypothetical protein
VDHALPARIVLNPMSAPSGVGANGPRFMVKMDPAKVLMLQVLDILDNARPVRIAHQGYPIAQPWDIAMEVDFRSTQLSLKSRYLRSWVKIKGKNNLKIKNYRKIQNFLNFFVLIL